MDKSYSTRMVSPRSLKRQRGIVMVILTIGVLAILAMSGLALDSGHIFLTKTRLQNAVDAAALGAAKVLSSSGSMMAATAEANATFSSNVAAPGNELIDSAWDGGSGEITLHVEFSQTISPFTPTTVGDPPYVRVVADGFTLDSWLIQVVGVTETEVVASAVSGPSAGLAGVCNIAPILACGCRPGIDPDCCDPVSGCASGDDYLEASFPHEVPAAGTTGIEQIIGLSLPAGAGFPLGPGNFQFLNIGDNKGSNDLKNALAGNSDYCVDSDAVGDWVEPKPGANVNAGSDGLNSRFDGGEAVDNSGKLQVPADYMKDEMLGASDKLVIVDNEEGLPEVATESGNPPSGDVYDYGKYANDTFNVNTAICTDCQKWRRMIVLPIGNCDGTLSGSSSDIQVHAYGCFLLLQRVDHTGQRAIFGQFVPNPNGNSVPGCEATGGIDPDLPEYAPTKIVLYRDSGSGDS